MIISKIMANKLLTTGKAILEGKIRDESGDYYAVLSNLEKNRTDHSRITRAMEIILDLRAEGYDDHQIADALCDGEYIAKELSNYKKEEIEDAYSILIS